MGFHAPEKRPARPVFFGKNDPKAQESLGCGWFLLFFMIFHGVEAPAKWRRNVCFPWEILGIFRRTRKPGGFHGFSRTRKSVGHACFFRVEDVYLNLGRHKTQVSFIIHSRRVNPTHTCNNSYYNTQATRTYAACTCG